MSFYDNPQQPEGANAFGNPSPPDSPKTMAEEFEEMKRRRAYFRQRFAEYDASRGEREEPTYVVWY